MKYSVIALALVVTGCGGGSGDGTDNVIADSATVIVIDSLSQANKGEVIRFAATDIAGASYEWALIDQPAGSAPAFGSNGRFAEMVRTAPGDYTAQVTVAGQSVAATTTVIDAGDAPVRPLHELMHSSLLAFATADIERKLRVPSSYQRIGEPVFQTFESVGNSSEGAISIDFNASNAFGVLLRERALCPINWAPEAGIWVNTISVGDTIDLCFIIN